ncbi:MAG: FAD-dependent oxidoreductase, partial [Bacteroidota bacterium]
EAAIKAINDVALDYYLLKPWDPPEEKLYPVVDDLLAAWEAEYVPDFKGLRVVGYQFSPKSHDIKDFLHGNLFPFQWLDIETHDKAEELRALHAVEHKSLPMVVLDNGEMLANPSLQELSGRIGLNPKASVNMYDVVIIGAGPSGLSAAVYGASEGLKTLLIERRAPGGQAGTSSRIENYLGFPSGLSGSDLARRAITQATRFGAEFLSPQEVQSIELKDGYKHLRLGDGSVLNAKAVVITTGVDYRKLLTKGVPDFTGAGVYYGAATTEAAACTNQDVYVVGGGNSAGQGAMYLSKFAKNVYIMIRRDSLVSTMSSYLIDQIDATENIHLLTHTEIKEAYGTERLTHLDLLDRQTQEVRKVETGALFIFIGAKPYTEWLGDLVNKDQKGFIITGPDLRNQEGFERSWKVDRDPYLLETSTPGVFAAGDVRSGAMNRVASAVGEGAMSISFVHKYLEGI